MWARIKGNFGRTHNKQTKLDDVKNRLDEEFQKLNSHQGRDFVHSIFKHTNEVGDEFWKEVELQEAEEELEEEEEDEVQKEVSNF